MIRGFTFERALSWPFSAPHLATFPWIFGVAYALVSMALAGGIVLLSAGDFIAWFNAIEAAEGNTDPEAALTLFFGGMLPLLPWIGLIVIASWAVWAMFETASQRRYIHGKGFSLGFAGDELRMMVVGLLWTLLAAVLFAVPMVMIFGGMFGALGAGAEGLTDEEIGAKLTGPMLSAAGLMLLLFPVYVFFATRLAPCFGLTVKDRKIRFFDAWNVSRERFWPILGAYLILSIAGGILGQVIGAIAQLVILPATMQFTETAESGGDVMAFLRSPGFYIPASVYGFITFFVQGVLQHAIGGPAAFAARNDPRGGVEQEIQIDAFS